MGGSDQEIETKMQVTQEEMMASRLQLRDRDYCAHLLIPLNKCRGKNYYLPWRCTDEKHTYEKCQYDHYVRRMKAMEKIVMDKGIKAIEEREAKEAEARGLKTHDPQ